MARGRPRSEFRGLSTPGLRSPRHSIRRWKPWRAADRDRGRDVGKAGAASPMGGHTGEAEERGAKYLGPALNETSRLIPLWRRCHVPHKEGALGLAWTGTTGGGARSPGPRRDIGPRWHRVRAIQVARCCDRGGAARPVRRWLGRRRWSVSARRYQQKPSRSASTANSSVSL